MAAKIDDAVYHFENHDGRLLLVRDEWNAFRHRYADLDNREIHSASVALTPKVIQRIERHLDSLLLEQQSQLERLDALKNDFFLLQSMHQDMPFSVAGMGFFTHQNADRLNPLPEAKRLSSIQALNQKTLRALQEATQTRRKTLKYFEPLEKPLPLFRPERFSDQWIASVQLERATQVLLGDHSLRRDWVIDAGPLNDWSPASKSLCDPRVKLQQLESSKTEWILNHLEHPTHSMGYPLLLALAQREVIRSALNTDHLLLLVPAPTLEASDGDEMNYDALPQYRQETNAFQHAKNEAEAFFCSLGADDSGWLSLSSAVDEWLEIRTAAKEHRPVRLRKAQGLPEGWGGVDGLMIEQTGQSDLLALNTAASQIDQLEQTLAEKYGYNLIQKNCVTALILSVNEVFAGNEAPAFGGHISPFASQSFIPFRFFELVKTRYRLVQLEAHRAFRHRLLDALKERDFGEWKALFENFTLTAEAYTQRPEDGAFLFFTEQSIWLRPLAGAINLGYATGVALVGLLEAPFDQGQRLKAGGSGMLFSLPELAGWNIRKGSYSETGLLRALEQTDFAITPQP